MEASLPPAVLLGGEKIAVSVARSLGRAGVAVHALGDGTWDTVGYSRWCTSFTDLGSGAGVQARWLEWLEHGPRGAVLLPCADEGLELVARNREHLADWGYLPIEANDEIVLAILDKKRTYELARQAGLAAPRIMTVSTPEEAERALDRFSFPCALKPAHSYLFARYFGLRTKAFVVDSPAELERALARAMGLGLEMLLTEIVQGGDDLLASYCTYLDERGEPLFHFTRSKVRQYPPHFGIGCYQVTRWQPDLAELGLRFFRDIGLRGLASVEFKRDSLDGQPKLIECNHRFTTATELTRLAGIDLALLTYNRVTGRALPALDGFREGVRVWDPVEDVRSFLISRREGELSLGSWVRSLFHCQHLPVFSLSDPAPSLAKSRRLLRRLGRARSPAAIPPFARWSL